MEPYLTFLNVHKAKDDAIAHLSDQLLALSTRLREIERKAATNTITSS